MRFTVYQNVLVFVFQLYALRKLMQGTEETPKAPLGNNARPLQELHHRTVRTNIDFKKDEVRNNTCTSAFAIKLENNSTVPVCLQRRLMINTSPLPFRYHPLLFLILRSILLIFSYLFLDLPSDHFQNLTIQTLLVPNIILQHPVAHQLFANVNGSTVLQTTLTE
jgi:hypothetical protein